MTEARTPWTRLLALQVVGSIAFRLGCYAVMLWLCLWAEARPAPTLPDAVLAIVPYVPEVSRVNYYLWLGAYLPIALLLLAWKPRVFIHYSVTAGLIGLVRGLCVAATGLGPVQGGDVNVGMTLEQRWAAFVQLMTPFGFFNSDTGARVSLTKDLFFSGHTATTFLLLLTCWPWPKLRWWALVSHVLIVASVFLSHLHYTIDVIGGYAITYTIFHLRKDSAW